MNAKKLPSGNWRAQAFKIIDGERVRKSFTAPSKAEAEFLASEWVTRTTETKKMPTIAEVVDSYIKHREAVLSPSTTRTYISIAKAISARFGRIVASDVTSEQLQAYINELAMEKSAKTVKNYINLLIPALNSVMPERRYNVKYPQRVPPTYNVPNDEAVRDLIEAACGELKIAILLGAVGGLRRGEICALKHEDILRASNSIYIHADIVRNKDGKWIYKPVPKTSASVRRITLPKVIIDLIPEGNGFIINHPPSWITDSFCRLRKKFGLKCRFHDLRHYCASYLHSIVGMPDQYIQERGGWASDGTLKNVYRNTITEKSVKFAKQANDSFTADILSGII